MVAVLAAVTVFPALLEAAATLAEVHKSQDLADSLDPPRCTAAGLCTSLPVVQIAWSHECEYSATGCIGTPNLLRTGASMLLATHDRYHLPSGASRGGASADTGSVDGTAEVYLSENNGGSWRAVANVSGMYWAEFVNVSDSVYLLGTRSDLQGNTSVVISRCLDVEHQSCGTILD